MPFLTCNGNHLHYELIGAQELPVVVLSNSLGSDLSMWDAQMPAMRERFRVLRYDTRGHGQSSLQAGETTLAALGKDLLALLDMLLLDHVHLCGVSLGGLTAMWVALHAPDRLHSLVLSNTAARIGDVEGWNKRIDTVIAGGMESIVDTVPTRWFTPPFLGNPQKLGPQRQMLLGCSPAGYCAASRALRDSDLRSEVGRIATPTLVLSAADDLATPPADGEFLARVIRGSAFRLLPGAHLCNIEFAASYNQALVDFLIQHTPAKVPSRSQHG